MNSEQLRTKCQKIKEILAGAKELPYSEAKAISKHDLYRINKILIECVEA